MNRLLTIRRETDLADFKTILEHELQEEQKLMEELRQIDQLIDRDQKGGKHHEE